MKRKNDQSWKPLAHLLSACGIPWIWYLADFIFSLLISMVTVRLPQMTGAIMQGEIFDKGLLADYVGITVFSMLLAFFSTVFGSWISLHTDRVLRKKIWEHFLYLPMTIYQTYKPSSLISRITQDTSGISYGISSCIGVLTNTWTIFLMLKNVYHMSPRMVASMAVVVPWLILVSVVTGRFAFRASCRIQERFSDFTAVIAERLSNIRGIRIHGEELTELEKGREAARRQYEADLYQARVNLFSQPFIYTSEAFLKALFLIYGGFLISRGELESGEFITIYMYLEMLPVFAIQYIFAYQTAEGDPGGQYAGWTASSGTGRGFTEGGLPGDAVPGYPVPGRFFPLWGQACLIPCYVYGPGRNHHGHRGPQRLGENHGPSAAGSVFCS